MSKCLDVDYNKLENEFLEEINKIRTDPKSYIPILEKRLTYFKGNDLYLPKEIGIITEEGPSAVKEAIEFLKKQKPIHKLEKNIALTQAAIDHVNDIGPKGSLEHVGSDKSKPSDRINRYGKWEIKAGENIDFGSKTGIECLISLLVDDGVSNRGHRSNLFNTDYKLIGISAGYHKEYGTCLVTPFAGGIKSCNLKENIKSVCKSNDNLNKNNININSTDNSKLNNNINSSSGNNKITIRSNVNSTTNNDKVNNIVNSTKDSKITSSTSTKTETKIINGKKTIIEEKSYIDEKGRKITEITETKDDGSVTKKITASGDSTAFDDDFKKDFENKLNLGNNGRKSEIITKKEIITSASNNNIKRNTLFGGK